MLLERANFGLLQEGPRKRTYFLKPHPDTLSEDDNIIKKNEVNLETYSINFNDVAKITDSDREMCDKYHPHQELLLDLLSLNSNDSDSSLF